MSAVSPPPPLSSSQCGKSNKSPLSTPPLSLPSISKHVPFLVVPSAASVQSSITSQWLRRRRHRSSEQRGEAEMPPRRGWRGEEQLKGMKHMRAYKKTLGAADDDDESRNNYVRWSAVEPPSSGPRTCKANASRATIIHPWIVVYL